MTQHPSSAARARDLDRTAIAWELALQRLDQHWLKADGTRARGVDAFRRQEFNQRPADLHRVIRIEQHSTNELRLAHG
jgi:hypothetical protein